MIHQWQQRTKYVLADWVSTNIAILLYNILRYRLIEEGRPTSVFPTLGSFLSSEWILIEQAVLPLLMVGIYALSGYYNNVFLKSRVQELLNTASTALVGTAIVFFGVLINDLEPHRRFVFDLVVPLYLLLFVLVYIPRLAITHRTARNLRLGRWGFNTLIVGVGRAAISFEQRLRNPRTMTGMRVVGFVDPVPALPLSSSMDGQSLPVYKIDDIEQVCRDNDIKRLIVTPHRNGMHATTELINSLLPLGLPIYITADVHQLLTTRPRLTNVASEPLIDITQCHMAPSTLNLKRLGDVVVSAIALVAISPLMAAIAALIKLDSPGPVIYRQERIGLHKKPFKILKFRSMTTDAESAGPTLSTVEDPRITRIGRVLRKYRLDELPQFWNVLRGDMSLVGPRPERAYYIEQIVKRAPHYTIVQQMRPGITSWGMVKYGYASTVDQMIERLSYDILYIENASFVIDLKILIYTIRTVLTGKGI